MLDLHNCDCMEYMAKCKDNEFDLAIVDPPYGIFKVDATGFKNKEHQKLNNDNRPTTEYFDELYRVSKNQIIWGAQYFTENLKDFSQLIIWNKKTGNNYFADGEAAYCSIPGTLRMFNHQWCGAFKASERGNKNIHPTQKPVALYKWLLQKYAKKGERILDTHLGSGSIGIACHDMEYDLVGCELDKDYFDAAEKRIQMHIKNNTVKEDIFF